MERNGSGTSQDVPTLERATLYCKLSDSKYTYIHTYFRERRLFVTLLLLYPGYLATLARKTAKKRKLCWKKWISRPVFQTATVKASPRKNIRRSPCSSSKAKGILQSRIKVLSFLISNEKPQEESSILHDDDARVRFNMDFLPPALQVCVYFGLLKLFSQSYLRWCSPCQHGMKSTKFLNFDKSLTNEWIFELMGTSFFGFASFPWLSLFFMVIFLKAIYTFLLI